MSDIHANLEALHAVLKDMARHEVRRIVFLGDIIGYGPNPREVLDFMKQFEFCLMGNHDRAVLTGAPPTFNKVAKRATDWTRKRIHPSCMRFAFLRKKEKRKRKEHWNFLMSLKPIAKIGEMVFAHDTPSEPGSDKYVMNTDDVGNVFDRHPDTGRFFIGHSHVPRIWTRETKLVPDPEVKYSFEEPVVVNVGSVGQPRDKDPRACYVIVNDGITFYRVAYDVEKTARKIRKSELDNVLADRLLVGK